MLGVRWAHSHPHRHQRRHQRLHQLQTRRRYHGCAPQRLLLHQRRREHLRGCGGVSAPRLAPVVGSEGTWLPVCLPSVANVVPPGAVRCKKRPRNSEPRHHQPRTGACQPCQPAAPADRAQIAAENVCRGNHFSNVAGQSSSNHHRKLESWPTRMWQRGKRRTTNLGVLECIQARFVRFCHAHRPFELCIWPATAGVSCVACPWCPTPTIQECHV